MAIAFDASSFGNTTGTQLSYTHTVGATATKVGAFVGLFMLNDTFTTATFGGKPMILVNKLTTISGGSGFVYVLFATNVARGANTVLVNSSASNLMNSVSVSYSGVDPGMSFTSGQTDNSITNTTSTTPFSTSVTTIQKNSWTLIFGYQTGGSNLTAGTGSTNRQNGSQTGWFDSNGAFATPGSQSMQLNIIGAFNGAGVIMLSISPAQSSAADVAASLVTSGYKWLTSTLYAVQQNFALRPYFTAQIYDDTIQPNNQFFSGAGNPPSANPNTGAATAPDGSICAAGIDGSGNLKFYRTTQLHAVAGVWDFSTTISTAGEVINDTRNIVAVEVSDYWNGSYEIQVWYYANFANDGTNLQLKCQTSTNYGNSWTEINLAPNNLPNNAIGNLAIAPFKPTYNPTLGTIMRGAFFIQPNGSLYDVYYTYGSSSGYTSNVKWNHMANSGDWVIHSLAGYSLNNTQYLVISGYHTTLEPAVNANYSLWVTALLNNTQSNTSDLWSVPNAILPIGSASANNLNSFTFPAADVFTSNNQTLVYITCKATLVDSLTNTSSGTTATVVTTHINYMLLQSDDGFQFSYPTVMVGTDATEFSNGSYANICKQNNYFYLIGAGYIWEYLQSNTTADISGDVIGYQISESAGQPSSITLNVANANNKWYPSGTGAGASAIARNRKILVQQGYYNASGTPESVPRNIYYIDDIQQNVSGTTNDLTIVGRDWFKKLKTTVTRFTYNFVGPTFFADIFDGTYISSWNQVAGAWDFVGTTNPPLLEGTTGPGTITLVSSNGTSFGHLFRIAARVPATTPNPYHSYFYSIYIDANNWLRLDIDMFGGTAWKVTKCINGSQTDLDSGSLPHTIADNLYHNFYIKRYDYNKHMFIWSDYTSATSGNSIQEYDPSTTSYVFKGSGTGEYDMTNVFGSSAYTVGVGYSGTGLADFRFAAFAQFNTPNTLGSVMRSVARIAGIFSFKFSTTFREFLFTFSNFTGIFAVINRRLSLAALASVSSISTFKNGEISFRAKANVLDNTAVGGFSFVFRQALDSSNQNDYYKFHAIQASTGFSNPPTFFRFERFILNNNKTYIFYNNAYDVSNNSTTAIGRSGVDITQWNSYRIIMIDGWFYAFVNDVMMAAWNDNNTSWDYQTNGTWGFIADANTNLLVENIQGPDFWKPVQNFTFNPGDDAEGSIESLFASLRAWMFSDLFGRFKAIFLNTTDSSTYTYQNQLYQQNTNVSDKEFVAQVTVFGSGVSATARNTSLFAGTPTRDIVIVDYTITQLADAQTRANNELVNANQYLSQYVPKQAINVGAEIFDAMTVINTGNNTTGINGTTRAYAQTIMVGGGNNNSDYSVEIDTGTL